MYLTGRPVSFVLPFSPGALPERKRGWFQTRRGLEGNAFRGTHAQRYLELLANLPIEFVPQKCRPDIQPAKEIDQHHEDEHEN